MAAMTAGVALVVLATLPHDWQDHSHWARVAWWPFLTGIVRPADLLINVLLYVPLGVALQWRRPGNARWLALPVAALLSVSMELAQVWSHDRFPSATDVVMNVAGCILGAHLVRRRWVESDAAGKGVSP
jgi:glycopeptide antibiotics resistance protein